MLPSEIPRPAETHIKFAPEVLGVKSRTMEVIWLATPAQNDQAATEPKSYSDLGQATRGNSELKETEFL